MIGNSQHEFTKGKSCLTNLIACYKMAGSVDKGRTLDAIYLNFSKAFNIVSHNSLVSKLGHHGLDRWTTRQVKKLVGWLGSESSG